jgi:hypothetical protein
MTAVKCEACAYAQTCFHALRLCEKCFPGTCKQGRPLPKRKKAAVITNEETATSQMNLEGVQP